MQNQNAKKFPKEKELSEYKKTEFLPTLEHKLTGDKNSIYCTTLLYAWDEIRKIIYKPLQIPNVFQDLTLLNNSSSFIGVLDPDEYTVVGEVEGDKITATAEFKKSLPFEVELRSYPNKLRFDNEKVASFGGKGSDSNTSRIIKILYYNDGNDYVIKLLPKDKKHEIILFRTDTVFNSMSEVISNIEHKTKIGHIENQNKKLGWKYYFADDDEVVIPKLSFNISTSYSTLVGNFFQGGKNGYTIQKAWQQTAFMLDEGGAEVKSKAVISVVSVSAVRIIPINKPKLKKLIVDKPFFLMLKKTNSKFPYLGLKVTNSELMIKE